MRQSATRPVKSHIACSALEESVARVDELTADGRRGAEGNGRGARSRNGRPGSLSVQEASQCLASVVLGLLGHAGIRRTIKAVIRPRIHVQFDRYSGAAQSIRIGQVFFEEEIETADRM